jgi:molybdopterin-containing oxidoreductase family iron-sulfur binding subunit
MDRRDFAKILTTSLFAGISCKRPEIVYESKVKPTNAPTLENLVEYNTTFPYYPLPIPIVIETYEGIPFRIKGNENDYLTAGKIPDFVLASNYLLFDKHRRKPPKVNNRETTIENAISTILQEIESNIAKRQKIAIISSLNNSEFIQILSNEIEESNQFINIIGLPTFDFFHSQWIANRKFFNENIYILNQIQNKSLIINFGNDFQYHDPFAWYHLNKFDKSKQFLITFEDVISLTGLNSNIRIISDEFDMLRYSLTLLQEILKLKKLNSLLSIFNALIPNEIILNNTEEINRLLEANINNLVVLCNPYCSIELQIVTFTINQICKVEPKIIFDLTTYSNGKKKYQELLNNYNDYNLLLFLDYNPYFSLNKDLVNLIEYKSKKIIQFSIYPNEMTEKAEIFVPLQTYFEFWLDHKVPNGTTLAQQKIVEPINPNSTSTIEFLFKLRNHLLDEKSLQNYEEGLFNFYIQGRPKEKFQEEVRNGYFISQTSRNEISLKIDESMFYQILRFISLTLHQNKRMNTKKIIPHREIYSGEYSNNPYLKELPDPVTNTSWISPIILSKNYQTNTPEFGQVIVSIGDEKIELPFICFNEYDINTSFLIYRNYDYFERHLKLDLSQLNINFISTKDGLRLLGEIQIIDKIAQTSSQIPKPITADLSNLQSFLEYQEMQKIEMYRNEKIDIEKQWAMVIDIDKCIGCNSCILACKIENNTPVVTLENIARNRDLFWIKVYKATYSSGTKFYPLMCQQCDNAPCESVCPVGATSHSSEGISEMTYNQCIGSRFCMVNCPYGVRRFNFLHPEKVHPNYIPEMMNPLVTVRSRGVSEKCTFCIHKINFERSKSKQFGDEENFLVKTACQEVCPVNAIIFGRKKELLTTMKQGNLFMLMPEFNTKPNVFYKMTKDEKRTN